MKKTYSYRKIDKDFRKWLEGRTGRKVVGLTLLYPRTEKDFPPQFWRFKLEGITNRSYGNRLVNSLFMSMTPDLRYLFGSSLLRVCVDTKDNTLVLDFNIEEGIYQKIDPSKYQDLVNQVKNKVPRTYEKPIQIF